MAVFYGLDAHPGRPTSPLVGAVVPAVSATVLTLAGALSGLCSPSALADPGELDKRFGSGGVAEAVVVKPFDRFVRRGPESMRPSLIARQRDGNLLVVGTKARQGEYFGAVAARFSRRGRLDRRFGRRGRLELDGCRCGGEFATSVVVQPDGKIVVGGTGGRIWLVRLLANGALDTSFDGDGVVTPFEADTRGEPSLSVRAIFPEPDGKLLVATDGALVRYHPDGALDKSFGENGVRALTLGFQDFDFPAWTRLPDGRLVAARGDQYGTTVARYLADG